MYSYIHRTLRNGQGQPLLHAGRRLVLVEYLCKISVQLNYECDRRPVKYTIAVVMSFIPVLVTMTLAWTSSDTKHMCSPFLIDIMKIL